MRKIVFELCAETLDACVAAGEGGANRVELCSALSEGGLTPSHGLVASALRLSSVAVHTMVRPQGDNYLYSAAEFDAMAEDIRHMRALGVTGVVFGLLRADRTVDVERTRQLVELARPLKATFHRAFDDAPSLAEALEDVIASGCDRVLTSGGCSRALQGASAIRQLVEQAGDRIDIAVGGGLRLENAAELARMTRARHFHGSLRNSAKSAASVPEGRGGRQSSPEPGAVRAVIERLHSA